MIADFVSLKEKEISIKCLNYLLHNEFIMRIMFFLKIFGAELTNCSVIWFISALETCIWFMHINSPVHGFLLKNSRIIFIFGKYVNASTKFSSVYYHSNVFFVFLFFLKLHVWKTRLKITQLEKLNEWMIYVNELKLTQVELF